MLPNASTFDELTRNFRWQVPPRYNIGGDVCDKWAARDPSRLAILNVRPDGREENVTIGALRDMSNRLDNVLRAHGIKRGALALPIAILFGPDALSYRLQNSGARGIVTNAQGMAKLDSIRHEVDLACVLLVEDKGFADLLARASSEFAPEDTSPDDPGLMIYTSGTTGQPKGALHGHRGVLGHLPGAELPHYPFPSNGDRFWTPADWAWAGGLLDVLLPSLHHGIPVVARKFDKFDPDDAFALMQKVGVRLAFIPPTALRMMRAAPSPVGRFDLKLRAMGSGGESLGLEALEWG